MRPEVAFGTPMSNLAALDSQSTPQQPAVPQGYGQPVPNSGLPQAYAQPVVPNTALPQTYPYQAPNNGVPGPTQPEYPHQVPNTGYGVPTQPSGDKALVAAQNDALDRIVQIQNTGQFASASADPMIVVLFMPGCRRLWHHHRGQGRLSFVYARTRELRWAILCTDPDFCAVKSASGHKTVPVVYIKVLPSCAPSRGCHVSYSHPVRCYQGKFVGGCDDVKTLQTKGMLQHMVRPILLLTCARTHPSASATSTEAREWYMDQLQGLPQRPKVVNAYNTDSIQVSSSARATKSPVMTYGTRLLPDGRPEPWKGPAPSLLVPCPPTRFPNVVNNYVVRLTGPPSLLPSFPPILPLSFLLLLSLLPLAGTSAPSLALCHVTSLSSPHTRPCSQVSWSPRSVQSALLSTSTEPVRPEIQYTKKHIFMYSSPLPPSALATSCPVPAQGAVLRRDSLQCPVLTAAMLLPGKWISAFLLMDFVIRLVGTTVPPPTSTAVRADRY
eukprot:131178-Rhodomonas_salina.6